MIIQHMRNKFSKTEEFQRRIRKQIHIFNIIDIFYSLYIILKIYF